MTGWLAGGDTNLNSLSRVYGPCGAMGGISMRLNADPETALAPLFCYVLTFLMLR
jgi:hypothetical protein